MTMSELKQKLLQYELAKVGFPNAVYIPESNQIMIQPDNDRLPIINDAGDIKYGTEHDSLVVNTLRPIVNRVNETTAVWDKSTKMPFEELSQFRVLAEYNNIMLAARDDTGYGRGLYYVTWQYNYDRTGLDNGHYTEVYSAAKEDFAVRSGLIQEAKLFTPEQASSIKAAAEYRIANDDNLTYTMESELESIAARISATYPKQFDEKGAERSVVSVKEQEVDTLIAEPLLDDIKAPTDVSLRRFMSVDLISFLAEISQKIIIHYPNDWQIDKKALLRAADSPDMNDKRLAWHVSSFGTHLLRECDVFITSTSDFNFWTEYRPNDPDMFGYFIEVTGRSGDSVIGNVFEVGNYAEHVQYVREIALPSNSVTLTYSDEWGVNAGKTITMSRHEYDNDRHCLMSESGNVVSINYHPSESVREMSELLQHERAKRMALPIGIIDEHLRKVEEKLAVIRGIPEEFQKASEDAKPTKNTTLPQQEKKQTFEELLKSAQAKADAINRQNSLNFKNQPNNKTKNIDMEAI